MPSTVGVRYSVRYLQEQYDSGNKAPLENLVRAWKGIKELPPDDPQSFFMLGGFHGEPFDYRDAVDQLSEVDIYTYWGGWCNHGNVLFPTWHRAYVLELEKALQRIVPGVMMAYWDETSAETLARGIPRVLTDQTFMLDGEEIDNPLRSFVLPRALSDALPGDDQLWRKPAGYETVRYPLSGLVGTPAAARATEAHNAQFPNPAENTHLLNRNVVAWLHGSPVTASDPNPPDNGIFFKYRHCLQAPNYTAFSNTTSAGQWNLDHPEQLVTALESPHNDMHLAVGGFDVPGQGQFGQIRGANGDMGENNTAGLDPIFFFHHCFVDRVFWLWQQQNGYTQAFDIIAGYKGTSSYDSQGPTPGVAPGTSLTMQSPLAPFHKADGNPYVSDDVINIENLGYLYAPGSLQQMHAHKALPAGHSRRVVAVRGVDRAGFQGSFVMRAYATVQDEHGEPKDYYLGHHSVLSRGNVMKCANCQTHLEVVAHFPMDCLAEKDARSAQLRVDFDHRDTHTPRKNYTATLT